MEILRPPGRWGLWGLTRNPNRYLNSLWRSSAAWKDCGWWKDIQIPSAPSGNFIPSPPSPPLVEAGSKAVLRAIPKAAAGSHRQGFLEGPTPSPRNTFCTPGCCLVPGWAGRRRNLGMEQLCRDMAEMGLTCLMNVSLWGAEQKQSPRTGSPQVGQGWLRADSPLHCHLERLLV